MKPRIGVERLYMSYAESLPPVREAVKKWAYRHCFKRVALYWQHRGNSQEIWCQCCGHREPCDGWLVMSHDVYVCPACGAKCEVQNIKASRQSNVSSYISTVEVFKGVQVVRTFEAFRCNYNDHEGTRYGMAELYQVWLLDSGREIITSRGYDRSFNYMYWHYNDNYSIGRHSTGSGGYYMYDDPYDISDNYLYPRVRMSRHFAERGITAGRMKWMFDKRCDISKAFRAIAVDSRYETLLKTGYDALFLHFINRGEDIGKYWKSVNIRHRRHYDIADPQVWCDYIDNLQELGLDIHNPAYICPQCLVVEHNRMVVRINRKRAREELKRNIASSAEYEPEFRKMRERFFGLDFHGDNVTVVCIKSIREVAYEGSFLHHCVFTNRYWSKADSLLLSARDNRTHDPVETIEVSLKDFKVLQSRGSCNHNSKYHDEILSLVNGNMKAIRKLCANGQ